MLKMRRVDPQILLLENLHAVLKTFINALFFLSEGPV